MLPWYKVLGAALVQGTGGWPGTRYWGLPWYKELCAALVQGTGGWPGTRCPLGAGPGLEVHAALVQGTGGWPGARGACCPGTRYWGLARG